MRVALHSTAEVANRAGRILLAEPALTRLGLTGGDPITKNPKVERATGLEQYDVVFTDGADPAFLAKVAEAGVACVTSADTDVPWASGAPLLVGASLATGIAPTLAAHEAAVADGPVTIAWTIEGRPLKRGSAVAFPDPVGSLWGEQQGRRNGVTSICAPVQGEWAGAMVVVGGEDGPQRSVGVADLGEHLEAIALAAGVVAVAEGAYPGGRSVPRDAAEAYLLAALNMGLEVAGFVGN